MTRNRAVGKGGLCTHILRIGHKFALNENFPESPGVAPNTINYVVLETWLKTHTAGSKTFGTRADIKYKWTIQLTELHKQSNCPYQHWKPVMVCWYDLKHLRKAARLTVGFKILREVNITCSKLLRSPGAEDINQSISWPLTVQTSKKVNLDNNMQTVIEGHCSHAFGNKSNQPHWWLGQWARCEGQVVSDSQREINHVSECGSWEDWPMRSTVRKRHFYFRTQYEFSCPSWARGQESGLLSYDVNWHLPNFGVR